MVITFMRRADRLLNIIQILRRYRKPVAGSVIAGELEVSLRTIYRDIETLIIDGVPIKGEAGVGYILEAGYDLPPLMFKADEIEAVVLGLNWIGNNGDDALKKAALDAIAKIGVILPKSLKPLLFETGLMVPPNHKIAEDNVDVAQIRRAIRENVKIEFAYEREDGEKSKRTIWPIAIGYFHIQRLVLGYCELRHEIRAFRTDRMADLEYTSIKYLPKRMELLKKWRQTLKKSGNNLKADN